MLSYLQLFELTYILDCNSRYYGNYFVDAVTQTRTYYLGIPAAILLTPHIIIETSLCYRFTWSTVCAWYVNFLAFSGMN